MTRFAVVAVVALAACRYTPPPVMMSGPASDLAQLSGEWVGEYWSGETGRSGSVLFRLSTNCDTACGDILMVPGDRAGMDSRPGVRMASNELIGINSVDVAGNRVFGRLEPYRDPDCGCRLDTTFEGERNGDVIRGTFTSRHIDTGEIRKGEWRVVRRPVW